MTKLYEQDVREMRRLYVERPISHAELAKMYGVSHATVDHIFTGRRWGDIQDGLDDAIAARTQQARMENARNGAKRRKTPENGQDVIRARFMAGASVADLVTEFSVPIGRVQRIVKPIQEAQREEQRERARKEREDAILARIMERRAQVAKEREERAAALKARISALQDELAHLEQDAA